MAYITDGLTDSGLGAGRTAHYAFSYDDQLNSATHPGQPEPGRTNQLIAACECDYNLMADWFGGLALPFPLPISVRVANAGGGAGWGPPERIGCQRTGLCHFMELVEQFTSAYQPVLHAARIPIDDLAGRN
jgi:hypothetical protein